MLTLCDLLHTPSILYRNNFCNTLSRLSRFLGGSLTTASNSGLRRPATGKLARWVEREWGGVRQRQLGNWFKIGRCPIEEAKRTIFRSPSFNFDLFGC